MVLCSFQNYKKKRENVKFDNVKGFPRSPDIKKMSYFFHTYTVLQYMPKKKKKKLKSTALYKMKALAEPICKYRKCPVKAFQITDDLWRYELLSVLKNF